MVKILSIFVAFLENMNFKGSLFAESVDAFVISSNTFLFSWTLVNFKEV